jgi:hypothetical protein
VTTPEAAEAAVTSPNLRDVYVGVGLAPAKGKTDKRLKINDAVGLLGLVADIDIYGEAHKQSDLPPDRESALALLDEINPPPTFIVDTGHGIQAWWLFEEPWIFKPGERETAKRLSAGWQAMIAAKAQRHGWKLDNVGDLARVMRVPGTQNAKIKAVTSTRLLRQSPDSRYTWEYLQEFCGDTPERNRDSESVYEGQRFREGNPCPICGGYEELPHGQGERCWGYLSEGGGVVFCTREEYAGAMEPTETSIGTVYAHHLGEACDCGVFHPKKTRKAAFDWRGMGITAAELKHKVFTMKLDLAAGIIPHGFTQIGARPKSGKSLLMLLLSLVVSGPEGGTFLGQKVRHGRVLYLALEEPRRRIQKRIAAMIGDGEWPDRLHVYGREWPDFQHGGLEYLDSFLDEYPDTVLVIIDTMSIFRGPVPRNGGYDTDYAYSHALSDWVNKRDCSLIVVTHTRKRDVSDDPEFNALDMIQNTTGLTAGADTVLVMARDDGVMTLYRTGRDIDDTTPIKLRLDEETTRWEVDEFAPPPRARDSVLYALALVNRPLPPKEIADLMGKKQDAIRQACFKMLREEKPPIGVTNGGMYYLTERGETNKAADGEAEGEPDVVF